MIDIAIQAPYEEEDICVSYEEEDTCRPMIDTAMQARISHAILPACTCDRARARRARYVCVSRITEKDACALVPARVHDSII
jgi:hypothetical protein